MDDQLLFDDLLRVAKTLGVASRVESFETPATAGGGSCVLRGEPLILLDARAPLRERIEALARALSELDSEAIFMTPAAREALEAMRQSPAAVGRGAGRICDRAEGKASSSAGELDGREGVP